MKIQNPGPGLAGVRESAESPSGTVKLLGGVAPELSLGERVRALVLELAPTQTLIDLKGIQVAVDALPGFKPGAELALRVVSLLPQPLFALETPGQEVTQPLPPLELGQQLSVRILERLPGGAVLIEVKGTLLQAIDPGGVAVGEEVQVQVERLQPQVVLQVLDAEPGIEAEAIKLLRTHLPRQLPAGRSLEILQKELARLAQDETPASALPDTAKLRTFIQSLVFSETEPSAERVAAFVRDGGLHYESKLFRLAAENPQLLLQTAEEDLKGLLLESLKELQNTSGNAAAKESILNHLSHIENQQALNLLALAKGGAHQLQIPFFDGFSLSTVWFSIERDGGGDTREGEPKERGYRILFFLDLERLGPVRIDAYMKDRSLRVSFFLAGEDALHRLRSELPGLHGTLQSLGYQEVLLSAEPLSQLAPEKRERFDELTRGAPTQISLLDVKV